MALGFNYNANIAAGSIPYYSDLFSRQGMAGLESAQRRARAGRATTSGGTRSSGGASGDLFDAEGLPTRLPTSPEEALQFQFAASNWARRKNESMLANAQATMRYGLGMINKFGPYSAATMMNPLLGQMSQNYMNMQYDQPDYSYFMRTGQQPGGGGGGGYSFSGAQAPMSQWPVGWQWPQEQERAPAGGVPGRIPALPNIPDPVLEWGNGGAYMGNYFNDEAAGPYGGYGSLNGVPATGSPELIGEEQLPAWDIY